jgi:hypothetical protein
MAPIDTWTLTGLMFSYLLWSVIPPLGTIQKELPPESLSLPCSLDCRKNAPVKSCNLITYKPRRGTASWIECVYNLSIYFRRYQINIFRQTKYNYCEKKADTQGERKNTAKLTIAATSKCRLCFYSVRSGKKRCGVLQKLLMSKLQLRVHTDTQQRQAPPPGRPPTFPCDGGAANATAAASAFMV